LDIVNNIKLIGFIYIAIREYGTFKKWWEFIEILCL
jgi:hypothetical protein